MKLTRGKIKKLYNKKKQTLKKVKNRKTTYGRKTCINKRRVNLARGTLKKFNYKKTKSTPENDPKYEGINSEISLIDKNITENLTSKNTNEMVDKTYIEEPVIEEPVNDEPVNDELVLKEPINEEPVIKEPINEEPIVEEPVNEEPINEEPVNEEPVLKEQVNEEPIVEEPVIEEPIVEESILKEPVTIERGNKEHINKEPLTKVSDVLDELISIDLNELIVEDEDNKVNPKGTEESSQITEPLVTIDETTTKQPIKDIS